MAEAAAARDGKRDLAEQFQARARAADGDPPPVADLKAQISQLSDSSPPQPQHPR
jgi:hypothetical protein